MIVPRSLTRQGLRFVSHLARTPANAAQNPLARFQPVETSPAAPDTVGQHAGEAQTPEQTGEAAIISGGPSPREVAMPKTAHGVPAAQAPDRREVWSKGQNPRANAMRGPRFEQIDMRYQPQPVAAIELIANEPIRLIPGRKAVCDGGGGPLGHPKVFINLDRPGPKACGYCGLRFEQEVGIHAHGHGH